MIESIIFMLISLIFESLVNLYINEGSYLVPLFSVLSLIFIYHILKNNRKEYFILSLIFGIIYDLVFTNFYILNALLFFIFSIVIYLYFRRFEYNLLNVLILSIIGILLYNILLFFFFNIYNYYKYDFSDLLFIIKHFFAINIIYTLMVYLLVNKTKLKNIF